MTNSNASGIDTEPRLALTPSGDGWQAWRASLGEQNLERALAKALVDQVTALVDGLEPSHMGRQLRADWHWRQRTGRRFRLERVRDYQIGTPGQSNISVTTHTARRDGQEQVVAVQVGGEDGFRCDLDALEGSDCITQFSAAGMPLYPTIASARFDYQSYVDGCRPHLDTTELESTIGLINTTDEYAVCAAMIAATAAELGY